MPPKKAAGKKAAASPQDSAMDEMKQQLSTLNRQCDAVERMLVVCSEQLQRSRLESMNQKKRIAELNQKFEEQETYTDEKCGGMFRMYKSGQAQLVARIQSHEQCIDDLRRELDEARQRLEQTKAEKDAELAEKTKKINEQKQKMEEMAISFGVKLKETLEQMSYHINGGRH